MKKEFLKDALIISMDSQLILKLNTLKTVLKNGISVKCVVNKLLKNNKIFGFINVPEVVLKLLTKLPLLLALVVVNYS